MDASSTAVESHEESAHAFVFDEATTRSPDGLRLRYAVAGSGPPVVLLHPFSDALESWWDIGLAGRLARTFRVVAIDARGHGGSDKPREPAYHRIEHRVADVLAVLDAARVDRAHVVGYSMGGWTALGLASLAPTRLRSLVIGGAHPYAQDLSPLRRLLDGGIEGWCLALERSVGALPAAWRARAARNDLAALSAVVADDRADQSKALASALATMTVPIRWIVGERDLAREAVARAAASTPRGDLVVVPRHDHFQTFVSAAFADAVAEFLLGPAVSAPAVDDEAS
jgi:pimeloyl-ACP methyl ester carboxylesterase